MKFSGISCGPEILKSRFTYKLIIFFSIFIFAIQIIDAIGSEIQERAKADPSKGEPVLQEIDKVKTLLNDRKYPEAEHLAREILAKVEASYGIDSLEAAQVIDVLVESIFGNRKKADDEARELIDRACSIRKSVLGPQHADVVKRLNNFAKLFLLSCEYVEAKNLVQQA
jgi:hypothetical protein